MALDRKDLAKKLRLTLVVSQAEARPRSVFELAEAAFAGGVSCLQLREKNLLGREYYERAKGLAEFCKKRGKVFIVNDRLDVAMAAGADGVHLGQGDLPARAARKILGPGFLLGVSAGSVGEAQAALADGADYLGVGAIFLTGSKVEAQAVREEEIKKIIQAGAGAGLGAGLRAGAGAGLGAGLVTVAIGGIKPDNAKSVWALGFDGLAVISGLTQSADPEAAARALLAGGPGD
ncbi:MAG: thiamine phosphate synthase [Deltaproteobacteria bacterium]|jgi:thiamine-phosphate pyrophosphorylase|nr:thiamine phosphate synthase [Deltaproteobacteria bacterium]